MMLCIRMNRSSTWWSMKNITSRSPKQLSSSFEQTLNLSWQWLCLFNLICQRIPYQVTTRLSKRVCRWNLTRYMPSETRFWSDLGKIELFRILEIDLWPEIQLKWTWGNFKTIQTVWWFQVTTKFKIEVSLTISLPSVEITTKSRTLSLRWFRRKKRTAKTSSYSLSTL